MPRLTAEHPFFLCDASFSGGAPRRMCVGACTPDAVGGNLGLSKDKVLKYLHFLEFKFLTLQDDVLSLG